MRCLIQKLLIIKFDRIVYVLDTLGSLIKTNKTRLNIFVSCNNKFISSKNKKSDHFKNLNYKISFSDT